MWSIQNVCAYTYTYTQQNTEMDMLINVYSERWDFCLFNNLIIYLLSFFKNITSPNKMTKYTINVTETLC